MATQAGMTRLVFLLSDDTEGPLDLLQDVDHPKEQLAFRRRLQAESGAGGRHVLDTGGAQRDSQSTGRRWRRCGHPVVSGEPAEYLDEPTDVASFSAESISRYRALLRESWKSGLPDSLSPRQFLEKLSVVQHGFLTRTGLLLFGTQPAGSMPSAMTQCVQYDGVDRSSPRSTARPDGERAGADRRCARVHRRAGLPRGADQQLAGARRVARCLSDEGGSRDHSQRARAPALRHRHRLRPRPPLRGPDRDRQSWSLAGARPGERSEETSREPRWRVVQNELPTRPPVLRHQIRGRRRKRYSHGGPRVCRAGRARTVGRPVARRRPSHGVSGPTPPPRRGRYGHGVGSSGRRLRVRRTRRPPRRRLARAARVGHGSGRRRPRNGGDRGDVAGPAVRDPAPRRLRRGLVDPRRGRHVGP